MGTQVCVERVGVPNVVERDFLSCFFFFPVLIVFAHLSFEAFAF